MKLIPVMRKYLIFILIWSLESLCYTNVFKKDNDLCFSKFKNAIQRTKGNFFGSVIGTVALGILPV